MTHREILKFVREDDFVEYFLFPSGISNDPAWSDVALENSEATPLDCLLQKVNRKVDDLCQRYIWHRDGFRLTARPANQLSLLIEANGEGIDGYEKLPAHLHGISHIGDNIQDEWFIVSLLFMLTKSIPGLAARVVDADGEFLLIEAAEHLPKWANPETCEGRVFIVDGELRLVESIDGKKDVGVEEMLAAVQGPSGTSYRVSDAIEQCVLERMKDYPEKIEEHHHRATAYVPVGVAAILRQNPQLVAPAVLAFCNRDPIDTKVCRAMRYFPPESCVNVSVVFTKCLYAMVMHSNYLPDRRTGWSMPLASDPNYKSHVLGMKLACGFEILASQAKTTQTDWESDKGWRSYHESLTSKGYFKDNIEGSQDHTKLLAIAKEYYTANQDSMRFTPKIGTEIVSILKRNDFDAEALRQEGLDLPAPDDDSWMDVSPEELDSMLMKRYGMQKLFSLNGNATPADNFASMVNDFLEQESEFDGVVPSEAPAVNLNIGPLKRPVKPKRTKSKTPRDMPAKPGDTPATADSPFHQSTATAIDFDAGAFGMHVKNILDLLIPEDRWDSSDDSDMSDYAEDEYDRNIEDMSPTRTGQAVQNQLQTYMTQMDRELAGTTIGQSFETNIDGGGAGTADGTTDRTEPDDFEDIENFKPVNIDVNTLRNMMESYQAQLGGPGPATNLLGSIGVQIAKAPQKGGTGATKQTDV